MKISNSFQRKFFGDYVKDFFDNRGEIKIPDYLFDGKPIILVKYDDYSDQDKLRYYLKMFDDSFPKRTDENGDTVPFSMAELESKQVIEHIEYMRYVLANNGVSFKSDEEEWNRTIQMYNR